MRGSRAGLCGSWQSAQPMTTRRPCQPSSRLPCAPPCPRFGLREMALRAQPVALIQRRPLAALERQQLDVVGRMAGRAEAAGLLRVHRLDVLVRVGDALVSQDQLPAEMTRGAGVLTEVRRAHAERGSPRDGAKPARECRRRAGGAERDFERLATRSRPETLPGAAETVFSAPGSSVALRVGTTGPFRARGVGTGSPCGAPSSARPPTRSRSPQADHEHQCHAKTIVACNRRPDHGTPSLPPATVPPGARRRPCREFAADVALSAIGPLRVRCSDLCDGRGPPRGTRGNSPGVQRVRNRWRLAARCLPRQLRRGQCFPIQRGIRPARGARSRGTGDSGRSDPCWEARSPSARIADVTLEAHTHLGMRRHRHVGVETL